jgi:hypothetical protein
MPTISGSSGAVSPSGTVSSETTYGIVPAAGTSAKYSRGDHTHGSPPTPTVGATLDSAVGTSANAYASILSLAKAGGIIGHGTVKNTLAVNTITIRRGVTDAFGTTTTTEDDILPSASLSYDISEPVGAAVPPYTAFTVEVKSKVGGAHSDYNLKNTSI